jgi:hypothetical protein
MASRVKGRAAMRGIFRVGMVALALYVLPASQAHAASLIAANCSSASVQAAISTAIDGDTVVIPTGSCTWTSGITTNKQIIISGQAKGSVLITHAAGSNALLDLTTGSKYSTEVRNINFLVSSGTGHYMRIGGTGMPPLIHDNYFNVPDFQLSGCIHFERNGGVIWNNVFESLTSSGTGGSSGAGSGCLQLKNGSGGTSWSTASTMGTADVTGTANVYIEDNVFNNIYLQSIDCDDNARTVIRHNTFNDSGFACHGADTSPYGARHTEVYDNTFVFHGTGSDGSIR